MKTGRKQVFKNALKSKRDGKKLEKVDFNFVLIINYCIEDFLGFEPIN